MPTDLIVELENRPGELARLGETLGGAGVNIEGLCAAADGGAGQVHVLVEDPSAASRALQGAGITVAGQQEVLVIPGQDSLGELGRITRAVADAGANITLAYLATGTRVVLGVDDLEKARAAV
jgi:hypothetical protein